VNYQICKNVKIGKNASVGDFSIIGLPGKSKSVKTVIGDNATIRSHTVIYAGNLIGKNFNTGHMVMVRESNKIGDNVSIGTGSCVEHHVKIGNGVRLHSNVFVPEYTTLEDDCWVGPNVVFTNAWYPQSKNVKKRLKGALVMKGAKIGANTTVLPEAVIGRNALVGAGSVVTKDVPDNKVVAGNPAKVINDIRKISVYEKKNSPG